MSELLLNPEESAVITLVRSPLISERLKAVSDKLKQRSEELLAMDCNEDTRILIKKELAQFTADFKEIDRSRIDIKTELMRPYDDMNAQYKVLITEPYEQAKTELNNRIKKIEADTINQKTAEVAEWANEYATAKGVDWYAYENQANFSDSVKKLQEQEKSVIDKLASDIFAINSMEHSSEILVEYRNSRDLPSAILVVSNRKKAIAEQERIAIEKAEQIVQNTFYEPEKTAALSKPTIDEEPDTELKSVTFTVTGSLEQLRGLVAYMKKENLIYEQH